MSTTPGGYPLSEIQPGDIVFGSGNNPVILPQFWFTLFDQNSNVLGSIFGTQTGADQYLRDYQETYPQLGVTMSAAQTPIDMVP